jgi:hypothetical protein
MKMRKKNQTNLIVMQDEDRLEEKQEEDVGEIKQKQLQSSFLM